MTTKIRIKVGDVEVDYEGPESFLDKKITELISRLASLSSPDGSGEPSKRSRLGAAGDPGSLAAFLKSKSATASQNKRFLATAEWLHRKGNQRIKTSDVTSALRNNHQSKLGNTSQCLSNNVKSGYCEKVGKEFFVTDDGRASLD